MGGWDGGVHWYTLLALEESCFHHKVVQMAQIIILAVLLLCFLHRGRFIRSLPVVNMCAQKMTPVGLLWKTWRSLARGRNMMVSFSPFSLFRATVNLPRSYKIPINK